MTQMAYPRTEVFWQISHCQTNKITNAGQNLMPRGGEGGGDRRTWNLPRHGNYSFLWTIYLRFDSCKIAQVRGQIEVRFHLLGLRYKAYKFHLIHIYFLQSAWMPMFFQISTLSSVRQYIFLHPAGNVFHLQS